MFKVQSKQKDTSFKVVSTESLEKANNSKFYALFNRSRHAINILGYGGQILSGITEFLAVYTLFKDNPTIGISLGLFAVFLFEIVGLRIALKTIIRSIVRNQYGDSWAMIEIFILSIVVITLLLANITFSLNGNALAFHEKEDKTVHLQLFTLDSLMTLELSVVESEFYNKDTIELNRIEVQKNQTIDSYNSTIKSLKQSKWIEGANRIEIDKNIAQKESEKLSKINGLDSVLLAFRGGQIQKKKEQIDIIKAQYQTKKEGIESTTDKANSMLSFIESSIDFLLLIFIVIACLSIIFEEVFFKGSDMELDTKDQRVKPNLLTGFFEGIYNFFYHYFYLFVLMIRNNFNYDYRDFKHNRTVFDSKQWFDNKAASKRLKKANLGFTNKSSIGFKNSSDGNLSNGCDTVAKETQRYKQSLLRRYKMTTVAMWYKRSDLVNNSDSKNEATQIRNREKYLNAKTDLESVGVRFIESKDNVIIKI